MTLQHNDIQITGIGLSCTTQNLPFEMFDSLESNNNQVGLNTDLSSDLKHGSDSKIRFESVISCPVEHLNFCEDSNDRILLNTIMALENALESAKLTNHNKSLSSKKCLIYIVLPDSSQHSEYNLNIEDWYEVFTDEDSLLAEYIEPNNIDIKFEQYSDNATDHLSRICDQLSEGEWDAIFFGGVDSFITESESNDTGFETDGVAFLVLEAQQKIDKVIAISPLIYINYNHSVQDKLESILLTPNQSIQCSEMYNLILTELCNSNFPEYQLADFDISRLMIFCFRNNNNSLILDSGFNFNSNRLCIAKNESQYKLVLNQSFLQNLPRNNLFLGNHY